MIHISTNLTVLLATLLGQGTIVDFRLNLLSFNWFITDQFTVSLKLAIAMLAY